MFVENFYDEECIYVVYGRQNKFSTNHFVFKIEEKLKLQTIIGSKACSIKVRDTLKPEQILLQTSQNRPKPNPNSIQYSVSRKRKQLTLPHYEARRLNIVRRFLTTQDVPTIIPPNARRRPKLDRSRAWSISRKDFVPRPEIYAMFERQDFLGEGKFGLVFKCRSRNTRR